MADNLDIRLAANGKVAVTSDPAAARLRLATLDADPEYVASLMDPRHPMHAYRAAERRGLQAVAARKQS